MKTKIEIWKAGPPESGLCRLLVQWRENNILRTVSSGVITPNTPPEAVAEELRDMGHRILKSRPLVV